MRFKVFKEQTTSSPKIILADTGIGQAQATCEPMVNIYMYSSLGYRGQCPFSTQLAFWKDSVSNTWLQLPHHTACNSTPSTHGDLKGRCMLPVPTTSEHRGHTPGCAWEAQEMRNIIAESDALPVQVHMSGSQFRHCSSSSCAAHASGGGAAQGWMRMTSSPLPAAASRSMQAAPQRWGPRL